MLIDGHRELSRALDAGVSILEVFFTPPSAGAGDAAAVLRRAALAGARCAEVSPAVFARIAYGDRDAGLIATAARPRRTLAELDAGECSLVAVMERVEKPGNLGAVLRTAAAAGVDAVIAADAVADVYGPNVIRASLGTVFSVALAEAETDEALRWLEAGGFRIVAATPKAEQVYSEVDYRRRTAIVLGSEAWGLSPSWGGDSILRVCVPMKGEVDSLNVSATAAVLFYEALRQRGSGQR